MQPIKFDQVVIRDEKVEAFCKCSICLEVFQEPICCDNCENHFCSLCISTWNQSQPNRRCPLCNDFKEKAAQRYQDSINGKITQKYPLITSGFLWQPQPWVSKHMNHECQFKLVKCKNPGCKHEIFLKDYKNHDEQCPNKILKCQWCHQDLQRLSKILHEEVCNHRCVACEICSSLILFSTLKHHVDNCPEKLVECLECTNEVKIKDRQQHLNEVCQNVKVDCPGCQSYFPRHQILSHETECQDFEVECQNCDSLMKRNYLKDHTLDNCVQTLKNQLKQQQVETRFQVDDLKSEILALKGAISHLLIDSQSQSFKPFKQPSIRFSSTYKHPEIYLFQQNTFAQIQDANSILKDRFIYLELDKDNYSGIPLVVTFFFPVITDRFVAFGIADISNLSQKKDYYKLNHLAYLFSANGVIYSSHCVEDNGRKRDFRFDSNQKLNLIFDLLNCKVTAQNLTTNQQYSIDIPVHLIQMHGKSFYPVVCLRGAGDQVQIIN